MTGENSRQVHCLFRARRWLSEVEKITARERESAGMFWPKAIEQEIAARLFRRARPSVAC